LGALPAEAVSVGFTLPMSLRAHLLLLLFSVAIGGGALTFANDRWHTDLEVRSQKIGSESLTLEKLRHLSDSYGHFLVTYDLVVFSEITYLGGDALSQVDNLIRSLDEVQVVEDDVLDLRGIRGRLHRAREILSNLISKASTRPSKKEIEVAEQNLKWVAARLDVLINRTVTRFDADTADLARQRSLQESTQGASLIAYGAFLFLLVLWSSRRLAGGVDSLAELVEYEVGSDVPTDKTISGPTEFRLISERVRRLILSLEETVRERTAALAGQVAEHQKTQVSLETANTELEKSVEELRKTQLALVQKERLTALGEMVGGISHDFNNVLVPITSYCSILLDQPDIDKAERLELLTIVKTAAEDAARIIERLQAFTRSADSSKNSEVIEIDEMIQDAVAMAEPRWRVRDGIGQQGIEVLTELGNVGTTVGNPPEVRQALLNLIFNAVDALPDGGQIRVSSQTIDDLICIEVSDNGTGMSEETRQDCLKPFFSTKAEKGTGLGLAMANNTALSHSGRLEIKSNPGSGTSVRILLKRKALTSPLTDSIDPEEHLSSDLRILLVDDDEAVIKAHAAMLSSMGYSPKTYCNPLQAIEIVKNETFDLVITDLRMPELSGVEFAEQVRSLAPETRILLLTGFEGGLAEYTDISFIDRVLRKPVRKAELLKAVTELSGAS